MKILDKYILKQFIKNFLFGILCFVAIFNLVDLFENLDKFIDKNLSTSAIIQYYIYFIPEILKLTTPVAILLATLFTISRLNNYSEMVAINTAGISLFRFSVPLFSFGLIITLFFIYFNGWIVSESNSAKFTFERKFLDKNTIAGVIQNLHVQDSTNRIIFIGNYIESEKTGANASIQIFDKTDLSILEYRFDAKIMKWDSTKNDWKLIQITERKFDSVNSEKIIFIDTAYASTIPQIGRIYLSPTQIIRNQLKPDELSLTEFQDFINSLEESGQDAAKAKVDYYSKISFPFASLVVILFGISFSINRRKSGAEIQFGFSILIAFIYLGFIKISQTFGYSGEVNPVLTAWLANITFFSIAVINILRVNILKK